MSEPIKSLDKMPLEFYKKEAEHFNTEHFAERHTGIGFLVSHGPLPQDDDPLQTQRIQPFQTYSGGGIADIARDTHPHGSIVFEIPLDKLKRKFQMNLLPIGRGETLPITVCHPKVSKFHGYFMYNSKDEFVYGDDSTNGTEIDTRPVPKGQKLPVNSCSSICLAGCFTFTYYSAEDFHRMLKFLK